MSKLWPGLCSVSFRDVAPSKIINQCKTLGIQAIEWGGDVHLPPGDMSGANKIRNRCQDSGISCPSYGSYYRVGETPPGNFKVVLNTAVALGCETIRVWAGSQGPDAKLIYFKHVASDADRIARIATDAGLTVSFEYHRDSLTETAESRLRLEGEIKHPGIRYYWQPPLGLDTTISLRGLESIGSALSNVHVFNWIPEKNNPAKAVRMSLSDGRDLWAEYLGYISGVAGPTRYCYIEFVRGDSFAQLADDWRILSTLIYG